MIREKPWHNVTPSLSHLYKRLLILSSFGIRFPHASQLQLTILAGSLSNNEVTEIFNHLLRLLISLVCLFYGLKGN